MSDYLDFPVILGFGSTHDLRDADPRNPRLMGFRSVSYAAACAIQRQAPPRSPLGFHTPGLRK